MEYRWLGMRVLKWNEVKALHEKGKLTGCYKLYPDGTEGQIDSGYDWGEIERHYENGGGFGEELQTVALMLPDGKRITAPEVVDISAIDTFEDLEYSLWNTIEEYLVLFGIRTFDDSPDWATVKAVQDKLLEILMDAGVNFKIFTDEVQEKINKELEKRDGK